MNPDEFVKKYGADAVRIYLAFIGPYNEAGSYPWSLEGVESMRRFLDRVVGLVALGFYMARASLGSWRYTVPRQSRCP